MVARSGPGQAKSASMSSQRTKKWKRRLPKTVVLEPRAARMLADVAKRDRGRGTVADRYTRLMIEGSAGDDEGKALMNKVAGFLERRRERKGAAA